MFKNKTFLITGASSGLGRALTIQLDRMDANIAIMSRNVSALEETAAFCQNSPLLIPGNITSEKNCQEAMAQVITHFGHLDHLVLNAGVSMYSYFEALSDLKVMHQLMETNYLGAIHCTYHALPYLKKTKGLITVISSIQGKIGVPYHTGYCASKHALDGFFNSLRMELDQSIDILMVSPGWIRGTELKKNALAAQDHKTSFLPDKQKGESIPLEKCCEKILSAMYRRKRELIIPDKYRWLPWLKLIAPVFLDNLVKRRF